MCEHDVCRVSQSLTEEPQIQQGARAEAMGWFRGSSCCIGKMSKELESDLSRLSAELTQLISLKRHKHGYHIPQIDVGEPDFENPEEARRAHSKLLLKLHHVLAQNADLISENRALKKGIVLTSASFTAIERRLACQIASAGSLKHKDNLGVVHDPKSAKSVPNPVTVSPRLPGGSYSSNSFIWPPQ